MAHQVVHCADLDPVHAALNACHNKRAFAYVAIANRAELAHEVPGAETLDTTFEQALRSVLRDTDRLVLIGELEAVLIFDDLIDEQHAQLAGMKLGRIFGQPLGSLSLMLEAIVAVVYVARQAMDSNEVAKFVEEAREAALAQKGQEGAFAFIDAAQMEDNPHWLLESRLKDALEHHQIGVDYQAITDLSTGEARQFEAIARWRDKGVILTPEDYLPALQSDTLLEFSRYFLRAVVHEMVDQNFDKPVLMRFSNAVLQQHDFAEFMSREINFWGIDISQIVIGMDVGSNTANSSRHIEGMAKRYANLGFSILLHCHALEDELWQLLAAPVRYVRLEPHAFAPATGNLDVARLVASAADASIDVLACGVEDADTLEALREAGVTAGQGFYLGPPIEAPLLATLS